MSNILQQAVLLQSRTPLAQFQRFRVKINIQRPKAPHYERARVIAVTQPVLPTPPKASTCFQPSIYQKTKVENPYNDIIAREVLNWLQHSRMIGIFHLNSITQDDLFKVRVQLHKRNMHLKDYGKKIVAKAVINTRFEAIVPLFDSYHCIVFSPEQRVAELLRITRRVPQMLLMAGIVDDTLLSRNELLAYAQLSSLQAAQVELTQTLNSAAGNLVQQLQTHQNNFVNVLDVYAKNTTINDSASSGDPSSGASESVVKEGIDPNA